MSEAHDQLEAAQNEIYRLRRTVDSQAEALNHWRRLSDQDTGTIARLRAALEAAGLDKEAL